MVSLTLVITSCCKQKLDHSAPVKDLYQGQLFKLVRQYAEKNGFDWMILSAKYGLVNPEQIIEPYDYRISKVADIIRLQTTVIPNLESVIGKQYLWIIVIMGKQYRGVIDPLITKYPTYFDVITDSRGIGGLKQQVKQLINLS